MTALLSAPPALAAEAAATRRQAMLALTRFEAIRMLRHPITVAAFLLYLGPWVWTLTRPGADRYPVLPSDVVTLQMAAMLLLGGATLVVANLAVLREHRHRTDAVSDLLVLPPPWRTGAFLLAILAPAALTLVVVGGQVATLAALPGRAGTVNLFDVAIPAAIVAVLGAAGALLAQVVRSPIVAPLTAVLLAAAGFVAIASVATGTSWGRLLPLLPDDLPIAIPSVLVDRPSGRHLAYLAGVIAVLVVLGLFRSGTRARVALPALAAALAVTVAGGAAQFVRDDAVLAARVTTTDNPAPVQTCSSREGVTYCAFDDFTSWIPAWEGVLRDVVRLTPPGAAGSPPLAVRQWVWADGYPTFGGTFGPEVAEARARSQRATDTAAGTPEAIPVGTSWGDNTTAAAFAGGVAFRLVMGRAVAGDSTLCGARGALVVWLTGKANSRTAAGLRQLDNQSSGSLALVDYTIDNALYVDDRDAAVGLAMLDRPAAEIASVVTAHWAELTSPETTIEQAASLLGVPVGPAPDPAFANVGCES
ncbi:ABC transporter [Asanoa ishikariensis]|uniref:ABC-type transport system involved in multi-copper enzyme maturation, permease component n=1 Tax=Asanoa ishikariensis TaxID=137265 RepID=A0A1H3T776_9ACTN|nr:hypothetical protein [Asanoa ishikariensis]GIF62908.1 ABC transporter [Asanoa ishikariensis]SDZ46096.1 hypothetical protein SAMN05421684_5288 [Asanoa ishikariensis]